MSTGRSKELHFKIGVVRVALKSSHRRLRREYSSLYRQCLVDGPDGSAEIRVEVCRPSYVPWKRRRYHVRINNRVQFEPSRRDEVLPHVDWAINWEVPRVMPQFLQLHASSMEVDGQGVIFPGESGSGKSTLTAGLMTRGWRYLCDEFALIHAESLRLHPYPRAICIKKPSYPVIESLGIKLHGHQHYVKGSKGYVGFINPFEVGEATIGRDCPIRYVIFPKYTAGAQPRLTKIGRAEAAFSLHRVCFNLFNCQSLGLDVLAGMIRGAECYHLVSGEIGRTCDLVSRLVQSGVGEVWQSESTGKLGEYEAARSLTGVCHGRRAEVCSLAAG